MSSPVVLNTGWNTITRKIPDQSGVDAIGLSITPRDGWSGKLRLDAVTWSDEFVRVATPTQLSVAGTSYRFDGINIYNANSIDQCSYRMGDNGVLDESLSKLEGIEVFRAWFFQSFATTNGRRDWRSFDHTLRVAAAHDVKVVVTLTNQWDTCDTAGYKDLAWYQNGYQQATGGELTSYRSWVSDVVTRYANDPTIAMWQLVNEAEAPDYSGGPCQETAAASALRAFTDDVGGLIHQLDPNHLVNLGTLGGGQCGTQNADYQYVHASPGTDLCDYHDYGSASSPIPGDQWNGLQLRITECATNLGKPIFVGESGIHVPYEAPSDAERAREFDRKLATQFDAGVVGELLWTWDIRCTIACASYDFGADSAVLALFKKY